MQLPYSGERNVFRTLPFVVIALALVPGFIISRAGADDIPYCDEIQGRGGACVSRDPVETYLVVSYIGAPDGQGRQIYAGFRPMQRSQCIQMLEHKFTRCYRIGMYTSSEERFARSHYGNQSATGGATTFRNIFDDKNPGSDDASSAYIQLQMATVDEDMVVFSEVSNCFRETGNTADCATFWIEPFTGD
jgi:hypothetical protein